MPNRNPTVVYPPGAPRRSPRLVNNSNTTTPKPKSTNDVEVSEFDEGVVVEGGRKRRRKHGGDGIKEGGKKQRVEGGVEGKRKRVSKLVPGKSKHDCFDKVHHDFHTPPQCQPRSRAKAIISSPLHGNNNPTKPKPKSTNKSSTRSRPNLSDEVPERKRKHSGGGEIVEELRKQEVECGGKRKRKRGGDGIEKGGKKEEIEGGVEGKRKRKRGGGEVVEGWTKEQELALWAAYFTAKPSPHFWKNVSKEVPGKSKQDCFDRVHLDFHTPPQCQPRSRAKAINSSLHSISASKLLIPSGKKVDKSNILKPKSISTQKSIENLLQRHLKVDQNHKGDIFHLLEPNIDFSTNAILPIQELCTPKQQMENQGFLQSSSIHKKSLSRFSGSSGVKDLASPPVLKQVKNKVQHEKYVNQLRFRDVMRRATSIRAKKSVAGEGKGIQKTDVVKAAKVALLSQARDAINKFQQSQINFMGDTCSSDIGVEDESP